MKTSEKLKTIISNQNFQNLPHCQCDNIESKIDMLNGDYRRLIHIGRQAYVAYN